MELNVLSEVFCSSNRKEPLKIGSIKSNIGHCEAASSLVSLAKALIVLDSGYIPPNINYLVPNPLCPALISGKLEVHILKEHFLVIKILLVIVFLGGH